MVNAELSNARAIAGTDFFRSSRIVRWGGFLISSGGVMLFFAAFISFGWMVAWIPALSPGYEMFAERYAAKRMFTMSLSQTAPLGAFLAAAGMLGVLSLLATKSTERTSNERNSKAGIYLALASSACAAALTVYEFMPRYYERDPAEFLVSHSAYAASFLGWTLGVLLVGMSALRARSARSLGRWRFAIMPLAVLCFPARQAVLLAMYAMDIVPPAAPAFAFAALIEAPRAIGAVGWVFFGVALAKAWDKELEATRKENLALARRFYEEAWGEGRIELIDDILALDFVDLRHHAEGAENFKHYLADLRATFPDLRLDIHSQTAEGDEVATRLELHGTDRGGVLYHSPTNKEVSFAGTFTDTVREGRIIEHRGEIDEAALFRQLGHTNREWGVGTLRSGEP